MRPTEKQYFFTLFAGGARSFRGGYTSYFGGMDFKVEGAIGGHGKNNPELAGAFVIQAQTGAPISAWTFAPRFQWDRLLSEHYAIYSSMTFTAGYRAIAEASRGFFGAVANQELYHGGLFAVGWGIQAIVAERMLLSFRPVNFELVGAQDFGLMINWDVVGGVGIVW